jgi:NitT/TauT family transport system ATP-binding protein
MSAAATTIIDVRDLSLIYPPRLGADAISALDHIELQVREGEFVSLIGPSGCGKSTLLRILADILSPTSGTARVAGSEPRQARLQRRIGMVFQDSALLEWRNLLGNVLLPLELMGTGRAEARTRAEEMLSLVGLGAFKAAYPRQLSGGMRQRAAIARAMITNPAVLFMDEPFGALDQITRDRLNIELLTIVERHRMTILFVTHSIREAVLLSDRIIVMTPRPGRIREVLDVALPRPRQLSDRDGPMFHDLVAHGTASLESGIAGHG